MEIVGDIVQIIKADHPWFPALLVVTDPKEWGIMGCVLIPESNVEGPCVQAYLRIKRGEYKLVGKAEFIPGSGDKDED